MDKTLEAYNRFRDAESEHDKRLQEFELLLTTLGGKDFETAIDEDGDNVLPAVASTLSPSVPELWADREQHPLWEAIRLVLSEAGELREVEIKDVLEDEGREVKNSAIQSALKTHPEIFRIRSAGRKKFVSLKK